MVHIKYLDKKGGGGELSIHYIYNSFFYFICQFIIFILT